MRPSEPWSFLNPHTPTSGTLHSVTADVRRCTEYNLCPSVHFQVSVRTVDSRGVIVYEDARDVIWRAIARTTTDTRILWT